MSLVFSGILPNSPLLLPTIIKDKANEIEPTLKAIDAFKEAFYGSYPDCILLLSAHNHLQDSAITINISTPNDDTGRNNILKGNFQEFGDFSTSVEANTATDMINLIKDYSYNKVPVKVYNDILDYRFAVPLYLLREQIGTCPIIPIGYALNEKKMHITFGEILQDLILKTDKRIAVITVGSLSHSHHESAPAGYSEHAETVDRSILDSLKNKDLKLINEISFDMREEVHETIISSLLIHESLMSNFNASFNQLAYEHPFGVGYLTGYHVFG